MYYEVNLTWPWKYPPQFRPGITYKYTYVYNAMEAIYITYKQPSGLMQRLQLLDSLFRFYDLLLQNTICFVTPPTFFLSTH